MFQNFAFTALRWNLTQLKSWKIKIFVELSQHDWFLHFFRDLRTKSLKTVKFWEIWLFTAPIWLLVGLKSWKNNELLESSANHLISPIFQRLTCQISQNHKDLGNLRFQRPYIALNWTEKLEDQCISRIFFKTIDLSNLSEIDIPNLSKP